MDTTNSSEKPQRRVEDRKPAEVIDWAAPGAPAVPLSPAATSGDAPTDTARIVGAPGAPEDQAFHAFWYGHMVADQMTGMLSHTHYVTAKYIWDAARIERAAAPARTLPTEIGERLRKRAAEAMPNQDDAKLMLTAADECDRFYGGMMNWKANAQAKDRTIIELRAAVSAATKPTADLSHPHKEYADSLTVPQLIERLRADAAGGSACDVFMLDRAADLLEQSLLATKPAAAPTAYLTTDRRMLVFADSLEKHGHDAKGMIPLYEGAAPSATPAAQDQADQPLWDDNGEPWNEAAEKVERERAHVMPPTRGTGSQHGEYDRAFDPLYLDVMNIICDEDKACAEYTDRRIAYKHGHRDARHEAADLVAEFASRFRAQGGNTNECATCGGSGIVGFPPDQYEACPKCLLAATPAASSDAASTAEQVRNEAGGSE